jgi:hypothetical protein
MSKSDIEVLDPFVTSSPIIKLPASTKKFARIVRPLAPFYPFYVLVKTSDRGGVAKSSGSCYV